MDGYIALVGLGAVGVPIANLLFKKYKNDFILLSSKDFLNTLTEKDIYINNDLFCPQIITESGEKTKKITLLIITVKNYHILSTLPLIDEMIDSDTIILPLQNSVYSYDLLKKRFPQNVVLEGFAKGPNTIITRNGFEYQRPGELHLGSSHEKNRFYAKQVWELLKEAEIECYYDVDIKHEVWKKLMLNVAGNAITAITGIDYCDFRHSTDIQELCRRTMREFIAVAERKGISLSESDIQDVINYYLSFKVSKHTSMLEDVLNKRKTENEYIAGYISKLAAEFEINTPNIDMLYMLVKVKENVYLKEYTNGRE